MNRTIEATLLRVALVAGGLFALLIVVVGGSELLGAPDQLAAILPFVSVAVSVTVVVRLRSRIDRLVERVTHHREVTPYSALAEAAQRLQAGSLDEALPGLARTLADGTGSRRAAIWLAVGEQLITAASYPGPSSDTAENLGVLLARPDTSHAVPVLDGSSLRAVLTIHKPDTPISPDDRVLIQDVANGAGLLLRSVAQNAELIERVRRADDLAAQLQASRQRLSQAREVERRRLLGELSRTTSGRLAAVRAHLATATSDLDSAQADTLTTRTALIDGRTELDDLLERFRIIARGVYPAVLRGQGPGAALEELAADLPRPVRLNVAVGSRLAWEIESGIYYAAAAILNVLAGHPADQELTVRLGRADGRVSVQVDDPCPAMDVVQLRESLTDDAERLTALGGELEYLPNDPNPQHADAAGSAKPPVPLRVLAWLPDRLEPLLEEAPAESAVLVEPV